MKTTQFRLARLRLLVLALGVGLAGITMAQTESTSAAGEAYKGKRGCGPHGKMRQRIMEKFDANKDGKLDETEKTAAKAAREKHKQEKLAKYDTNHDGQLDDAEKTAMKADRKAKWAEKKKQFDSNSDGKLDETERDAMKKAWQQNREQRAAERSNSIQQRVPAPATTQQ
jgi:hypothetical protein